MATIVGIPNNKLILNSRSFRRERSGLERITDTYTARTADFAFFYPKIVVGFSHKQITDYVYPAVSASSQYTRMIVEDSFSEDRPGDMTKFTVTYVGIAGADIAPEPIISYSPAIDYVNIPFVISIEFVQYIGEKNGKEETTFVNNFSFFKPAPPTINGKTIPVGSYPLFSGSAKDAIIRYGNTPFFSKIPGSATVNGIPEYLRYALVGTAQYNGLVVVSSSYTRYGLFAHAIINIAESAYFQAALSLITTDSTTKYLNWPEIYG